MASANLSSSRLYVAADLIMPAARRRWRGSKDVECGGDCFHGFPIAVNPLSTRIVIVARGPAAASLDELLAPMTRDMVSPIVTRYKI